jgi:hypothetical protein
MATYLPQGGTLGVGEYITSNNGFYRAIMQEDGNLCVYRKTSNGYTGFVWGAQSKSQGKDNWFTIMQSDGNLCVYRGTPSNNGGYLWCANTVSIKGKPFFTLMQDDGNLCIYRGSDPSHQVNPAVWCTGPDGAHPVKGIRIINWSGVTITDFAIRTERGLGYRPTSWSGDLLGGGNSFTFDLRFLTSNAPPDGNQIWPQVSYDIPDRTTDGSHQASANCIFSASSSSFAVYIFSGGLGTLSFNNPSRSS